MLYCYKSCTVFEPIHYHLLSDFNIGPISLHTLLEKTEVTNCLEFISSFRQVFLDVNVISSLASATKSSHLTEDSRPCGAHLIGP